MLKKTKNLLGRPVASYIEVLMAHHAIFPSLRRKDYVTSHTKKKIELEKYIVITTNNYFILLKNGPTLSKNYWRTPVQIQILLVSICDLNLSICQ